MRQIALWGSLEIRAPSLRLRRMRTSQRYCEKALGRQLGFLRVGMARAFRALFARAKARNSRARKYAKRRLRAPSDSLVVARVFHGWEVYRPHSRIVARVYHR